jgi:hypothetical protein
VVLIVSCGTAKGALEASAERVSTAGLPPLAKGLTGQLGLLVLVVTQRDKHVPIGTGVGSAGPTSETIGGRRMIGAFAKRFLESLQ